MANSKIAIFQQFLDVFSAQDDRIYFWSFACYQASKDTSLEYPQRVFWSNLKIHFFTSGPNFVSKKGVGRIIQNLFFSLDPISIYIKTT